MLETNEQIDVDERPEDPGEAALHAAPAEVENRRVPTDDRSVAARVVAERRKRPRRAARQHAAKIDALLLRDLGESGQRMTMFVKRDRKIADGEDIFTARH